MRTVAALDTLKFLAGAYDRYVNGLDDNALSLSAQRGGQLFFSERLECFHCHGPFAFTDSVTFQGNEFDSPPFHNNGLYNIDGVNVGGPPPKPLPQFVHRIDGTTLYVQNRFTESI